MHMEDDDETSSRIASLLYCDEDPLVSTTPPPPPPPPSAAGSCVEPPQQQQQQQASVVATAVGDVEEEDHLKELVVDYMARQRFYAPATCRGDYLEHLHLHLHLLPRTTQPQGSTPPPPEAMIPGGTVSGARSKGVHYIIYAFGRLGLTVGTLFNAVNYLDRFLSINCHLWWETWMVELVSVACLSIACKLDEVNIPSLHHLQMEEVMSHSFLPATVRDMELTLLKALQWRLACVTSYSFLSLLLPLLLIDPQAQAQAQAHHTTAAAAAWTTTSHRCTHLLIRSLAEPSFIQFDSSVVASSALRCVVVLEEDHHRRRHYQTFGYNNIVSRLIRLLMDEADDAADACFRMMKTLYDTSCCSESDWNCNWNTHHHHELCTSDDDERLRWSPGVSVIRRPLELQTSGGGGCRLINSSRAAVGRRRLFGSSSASAPQAGSTQLQHDDDTTHVVRDEDISHT